MRAAKLMLKFGAAAFMGVSTYTGLSEPGRCLLAYKGPPNPYYCDSPFRWNFNWDRRDPKAYADLAKSDSIEDNPDCEKRTSKSMTPTASRHILLVRHGQYMETGTTDKDRCLTPLGRHQADITGQRLKELSLPYKSMTSSTMTRAQETAQLIQVHTPQLELSCDPCLAEGAPAQPDPVSSNWRPSPEQFFQDGARIEHAFRKYFHRADPEQMEDSYELVVCHSNVIRYFVCRALQFPTEGWIRVSLANCSMTLISIHPDGSVVMEMMGDHGHIPPESVSFH